jgi:hypothetical protein
MVYDHQHHYRRFYKDFCMQEDESKLNHERIGSIKPQEKKRQGIRE